MCSPFGFPIQFRPRLKLGDFLYSPTSLPWSLLEKFPERAEKNHGQSLKVLARRGGLCPSEALAIIEDIDLFSADHSYESQLEAGRKLWQLIGEI